jgi:hypothetical protein
MRCCHARRFGGHRSCRAGVLGGHGAAGGSARCQCDGRPHHPSPGRSERCHCARPDVSAPLAKCRPTGLCRAQQPVSASSPGVHPLHICPKPQSLTSHWDANQCRNSHLSCQAASSRDRLPAETLSAQQQRQAFADKGLQPQEMVAVLGAHTVSLHSLLLSPRTPFIWPCWGLALQPTVFKAYHTKLPILKHPMLGLLVKIKAAQAPLDSLPRFCCHEVPITVIALLFGCSWAARALASR